MTRLLAALLCIITGIWLIKTALQHTRRKYILLSGHREGKLWVKRI